MERTGVAAMALGIVERCLELCVQYAKDRVQFGHPIGDYQLIQLKLARMEVARLNLQNLVFRQIEMGAAGHAMNLAEASSTARRYPSASTTQDAYFVGISAIGSLIVALALTVALPLNEPAHPLESAAASSAANPLRIMVRSPSE